MIITDPVDALVVAHERGDRLQAEAENHRLFGRSRTRRALAASLRRTAERLDPMRATVVAPHSGANG